MKLRYNDEEHAYWLDGIRCKGVTTVAKIPDDLWRLQQWEKRQVAIGLALKPKLVESVAAHLDERDVLDRLCNQAKEEAGAHDGRDRGITAHKIAERFGKGQTVVDTPLAAFIVPSIEMILETCGFTIIPEFIERIICYPEQRICGRLDWIVRTVDGRLVILDFKGGQRAIDYPHSMAIQLGLYANAPLMAGPLSGRGETEVFEPMPDVDKDTAIIISLPEEGEARAVEIDIAKGWKAAQKLCFLTLRWRATKNLIRPIRGQSLKPVTPIRSKPLDEGRDADPTAVAQLRAKVEALPADKVAWLTGLAKDAHGSGHAAAGLSLRQKPSLRRFELARALYALAQIPHPNHALVGILGQIITVDELQPLGAYVGSLDVEAATRFAHLVDQLVAGEDTQAAEPQPAA